VEVVEGLFNLYLGSIQPIPESVFMGDPMWLELNVEGETLSPRQKLVSVPYVYRAANADHADTAEVAITGAPDDDWTISGNDVYRDSGNVGIGVSTPTRRLEVDGEVEAGGFYDSDNTNFYINPSETGMACRLAGQLRAKVFIDHENTDYYMDPSRSDTSAVFAGKIGIGTTSPAAKLDLRGTLNVGEDGAGHDVNLYGTFSGTRLFWDPANGALRAGRDSDGTHWIPDSIGRNSIAMGYNSLASGNYSSALGTTVDARGSNSFALGSYSSANGWYSTAIGQYVSANNANSIVLGRGILSSNRLINNISNSLMVGFQTTTPTLFVGGPDHRVGIGTSSPAEKLHVTGHLKVDSTLIANTVSSNSPLQLQTDGTTRIFMDDATGNVGVGTTNPLYSLDVQGPVNATTYHGDGSNLTGIATDDSDWIISGNDMYANVSDDVGIGTTTPTYNLHIRRDQNSFLGTSLALENQGTGAYAHEAVYFNDDVNMSAGIVANNSTATESNLMRIYNDRSSGDIALSTNGQDRIHIDNSGRVGIGTTVPVADLDVNGNTLLDGYTRFGSDVDAVQIFEIIEIHDSLSTLTIETVIPLPPGWTVSNTRIMNLEIGFDDGLAWYNVGYRDASPLQDYIFYSWLMYSAFSDEHRVIIHHDYPDLSGNPIRLMLMRVNI
jgi:hypothetical protein